jgi:hypothetical protein
MIKYYQIFHTSSPFLFFNSSSTPFLCYSFSSTNTSNHKWQPKRKIAGSSPALPCFFWGHPSLEMLQLAEDRVEGETVHKLQKYVMPTQAKKKTTNIWDRCYDFLNIFAKKFGEKMAFFYSKHS